MDNAIDPADLAAIRAASAYLSKEGAERFFAAMQRLEHALATASVLPSAAERRAATLRLRNTAIRDLAARFHSGRSCHSQAREIARLLARATELRGRPTPGTATALAMEILRLNGGRSLRWRQITDVLSVCEPLETDSARDAG